MPLDSEWHLLSNIEMLPEADLMALDEDLRWDQDIQQTSSTGISGGLSHPCTLPLLRWGMTDRRASPGLASGESRDRGDTRALDTTCDASASGALLAAPLL